MVRKKLILMALTVFLFASSINSQTITVDKLPKTIDEFVKLRNEIATKPEGGATIVLLALKIYAENSDLGKQCMVVALDKNRLTTGSTYKGYSMTTTDKRFVETMLGRYKNIMNSYIKGSSTKTAYTVKKPFVYEFSTNPHSGDLGNDTYKLFVKCSGAASPRPITLKKNNRGIWKASNWNSVLAGVKKPPVSSDDDI